MKGDREIFIFPVQLTTSRIGNLTRLILTLAICDDHTYIHGTPQQRKNDTDDHVVHGGVVTKVGNKRINVTMDFDNSTQ